MLKSASILMPAGLKLSFCVCLSKPLSKARYPFCGIPFSPISSSFWMPYSAAFRKFWKGPLLSRDPVASSTMLYTLGILVCLLGGFTYLYSKACIRQNSRRLWSARFNSMEVNQGHHRPHIFASELFCIKIRLSIWRKPYIAKFSVQWNLRFKNRSPPPKKSEKF